MSFRPKPWYFVRDWSFCTQSASSFFRNPLNFYDTTGSKCTDNNDGTQANIQDPVVVAPVVVSEGDVYVSTWIQQKYEDADEQVAVTCVHATWCNDQSKFRQMTITLANQEITHESTRGANLELTGCIIGSMLKQTSTCTHSTKGVCFYLLEEIERPRIAHEFACKLRTLIRDNKTGDILADLLGSIKKIKGRYLFLFLHVKRKVINVERVGG